MKRYNLSKIDKEKLMDVEGLKKEYKKYLKRVLKYDDFEAEYVTTDLDNPYETEYLDQEYLGEVDIDGFLYEARTCWTNLMKCGMFHLADKKPFEFLMLFDTTTMSDYSVGSYSSARKLFLK